MLDRNPVSLLPTLLTGGGFGLEKESLRVTSLGHLAHTPHPFPDNANIDRDFCENQVELITPVCGSVNECCTILKRFHERVEETLYHLETGREYLWAFSNPPYVNNAEDIPVARFTGIQQSKSSYREYLAQKYGKYKMLYSGIHFNYSYPKQFIQAVFEQKSADNADNIDTLRDDLYLQLAQKGAYYSWLIVALTAASPLSDGSFWRQGDFDTDGKEGYSSLRCSELGYWNDFIPVLDYSSIDNYVASINRYIERGLLRSASELYYPIRLKPTGSNQLDQLKNGVNHIEFRMIDLNPLSPFGIMEQDVEFLHQMIAWLTLTPPITLTREEQIELVHNMRSAAHFPLEAVDIIHHGKKSDLLTVALQTLEEMQSVLGETEAITFQRSKLLHKEKRYAEQVKAQFEQGFVSKGLELVAQYADEIAEGAQYHV